MPLLTPELDKQEIVGRKARFVLGLPQALLLLTDPEEESKVPTVFAWSDWEQFTLLDAPADVLHGALTLELDKRVCMALVEQNHLRRMTLTKTVEWAPPPKVEPPAFHQYGEGVYL